MVVLEVVLETSIAQWTTDNIQRYLVSLQVNDPDKKINPKEGRAYNLKGVRNIIAKYRKICYFSHVRFWPLEEDEERMPRIIPANVYTIKELEKKCQTGKKWELHPELGSTIMSKQTPVELKTPSYGTQNHKQSPAYNNELGLVSI